MQVTTTPVAVLHITWSLLGSERRWRQRMVSTSSFSEPSLPMVTSGRPTTTQTMDNGDTCRSDEVVEHAHVQYCEGCLVAGVCISSDDKSAEDARRRLDLQRKTIMNMLNLCLLGLPFALVTTIAGAAPTLQVSNAGLGDAKFGMNVESVEKALGANLS